MFKIKNIYDVRKYQSAIFMGYNGLTKRITYHYDKTDAETIIADLKKLISIFESGGNIGFKDLEDGGNIIHIKRGDKNET